MTATRPTSNQRPIQVNRRDQPQAASSSNQSTEPTGTGNSAAACPGNKKKPSKLSALLGGLLDSRSLPVENDALKKEITLYLSTPLISKKDFDSFDLLAWWKIRQDQFPLLFVVARKVLGFLARVEILCLLYEPTFHHIMWI